MKNAICWDKYHWMGGDGLGLGAYFWVGHKGSKILHNVSSLKGSGSFLKIFCFIIYNTVLLYQNSVIKKSWRKKKKKSWRQQIQYTEVFLYY